MKIKKSKCFDCCYNQDNTCIKHELYETCDSYINKDDVSDK